MALIPWPALRGHSTNIALPADRRPYPIHNFPILLDQDSARMRAWRVFVLPTSFLVDKQGQIRYSLSGHIEWDEPEAVAVIEKLLAE